MDVSFHFENDQSRIRLHPENAREKRVLALVVEGAPEVTVQYDISGDIVLVIKSNRKETVTT